MVLSEGGEQDRSGAQEYLFPQRCNQPAEKVERERSRAGPERESTAARSPNNQPREDAAAAGRERGWFSAETGGQDRRGSQEYLFPRRCNQPAEKVDREQLRAGHSPNNQQQRDQPRRSAAAADQKRG